MNGRHSSNLNRHSRRETLTRMGCGFGGLALGTLLGDFDHPASGAETGRRSLLQRSPHHQPQARAVIQLFMHGGPSQVDLLDPKPELSRLNGQTPPAEVADDENRTTYLLGSPFRFTKHGQSGLQFSEVLPGIAQHADDIAVIRSMFTEHRNHEQAIWMANTGLIVSGRPNIGSWVAYGLGAENQNLPAYVALPGPVRASGRRCPKLVERVAASCLSGNGDSFRRHARAAFAAENCADLRH